jgi:exodeoxyribonuclease VII small subunit
MADERYTFAQARERLEEIVTQVRKKDVSLEQSLDLLEEGVRLANVCTELSDHSEWRSVAEEQDDASGESVADDITPGDEPTTVVDSGPTVLAPESDSDIQAPESIGSE